MSLATVTRTPANAADGFHDTSGNAPRCAAISIPRTSGFVQHAAAAALCASVILITAAGDVPEGAAGDAAAAPGSGAADAPARPIPEAHAPPPAPPAADSDTSDGSAADALTYSANLTVSVPAFRSRAGRRAASRRGASASASVLTAVPETGSLSTFDRSAKAPRSAFITMSAPHAAAAAFWAGVSETASSADVPGGAASWASPPAAAADAPARAMPEAEAHAPEPSGADSDTSDGSAADALTYSANRTVSVPAPSSITGGPAAASISGAMSSPSTSRAADCAAIGLPDTSENAPGPTATNPPAATVAAAAAFSCGERETTISSDEAGGGTPGTGT